MHFQPMDIHGHKEVKTPDRIQAGFLLLRIAVSSYSTPTSDIVVFAEEVKIEKARLQVRHSIELLDSP